MANRRYCRIKRLPPELWAEAAATAVKINPENARRPVPEGASAEFLIQNTGKLWPRYQRLAVEFLDDASPAFQARILAHMNEWHKYGQPSFQLTPRGGGGEVRISLNQNDGFWSLVGTDILHAGKEEATMNLALKEDASEEDMREFVRHEAGHTLGFEHEHSRRSIVNRIDRDKAYEYFAGEPNNWSEQQTDDNVLTPLDDSLLMNFPNSIEDVRSIMCYELPAEIMKDGVEVPGGNDIDGFDAMAMILTYGGHYTIKLAGQLSDRSNIDQSGDGKLGDPKGQLVLLNLQVNLMPGDNYMQLQYRLGGGAPWMSTGQWTTEPVPRLSVAFKLSDSLAQQMSVVYAIQDEEGRLATGIDGSLAQLPDDSAGIMTLYVAIGQKGG